MSEQRHNRRRHATVHAQAQEGRRGGGTPPEVVMGVLRAQANALLAEVG